MKNNCFTQTRKIWAVMLMLLTLSLPGLAQKITVHGYVDDEEGEALIGASVIEKGTANGAATDIDGNFTINCSPNATLVISYIGYDAKEVAVDGRTNIKVTMTQNSTMLQETVVIGYGTVKKQDATGSVAIFKPDEVEAGLATSVQDMLVGQTPGVVVTTSGGPSGGANIRIRGGASLSASNDPLIVLDGVPLSNDTPLGMGSPLAMINPESIESMTILKDASATAIYGSRASNGVIIITTKKGKSGQPQVTFAANMYVDYARKTAPVLSGNEMRDFVINRLGKESTAYSMLGDANTDWQKEVFRTAISQDYALAISGGIGNVPYRIEGSFTNNNGILKRSDMDRSTVGITLTPKFFDDHLSINAKAKGYYVRNDWSNTGAIGDAVSFNPTLPVKDYRFPISSGSAKNFGYVFDGYTENATVSGGQVNLSNNGYYNPVADMYQQESYSNVYRSNGNIQFDYSFHFLPELHANLNLGYDVTKSNDYYEMAANSHMAWKSSTNTGGGRDQHSFAYRSNTLLEFYLNYKKEFEAIKSVLDATAGYTWSRDSARGSNVGSNTNPGWASTYALNAATLLNDGTYNLDWNMNSMEPGQVIQTDAVDEGGNYHWRNHLQLLSFFGRVNYTFREKYLFTATVRGDATSRFSKDNRWGIFPAVALGWRVNDETFMENARGWLSELKLRAGWGETGQQAVGSTDNYTPVYIISSPGSYYTNGQGGWLTPYYLDGATYNPDLKWETTETWNVGIDYGFFNNRLSGSIEYYLRKTRDLLSTVAVAAGSSTAAAIPQNIGKMENYGIEFNIFARPVVTDDFAWTISYNIGWNHNRITDLNGLTFGVGGGSGTGGNVQIQKEGHPAYSFNLLQQVYDEAGNPVEGAYVDQNADGVIDSNDLVVRYSKDPKVTMSLGMNFRYKKWDAGFSLRSSLGNYVYAGALRGGITLDGLTRNNQLSNFWKSDIYFGLNPDVQDTNRAYSDYWLRNGSFVRCDNINVGYTFDSLLNNTLNLRLFGAVQNPFVITKYKGLDPEVFSGVDGNIYPRATTWSLGLVAKF